MFRMIGDAGRAQAGLVTSRRTAASGWGGEATARLLAAALLVGVALGGARAASAEPPPATACAADVTGLRASLRAELEAYLERRRTPEHISAVSLHATIPGCRPIDVAVGSTRVDGGRPISTQSLWQIGSNTKAFTAVVLLQLEAEGKLSIDDTLDEWLPQYPAWGRITIRQLLNMTSGIPDYVTLSEFLLAYVAAPDTVFSAPELVSYAVGLPLLQGWYYSNTAYILAQMIIESAGGETLAEQLRKRIIAPLGLRSTFYCPEGCPRAVTKRLPASYFFEPADFPEFASLLGKDQHRRNMSWAQGAGAIISSLADLTTWVRALYEGRMLPPQQQRELESLVALDSGQPIQALSPEHPRGFGLGVTQALLTGLEPLWWYQGEGFGFRVVHVFGPDSGIAVTMGVNSVVDDDNNDFPELGFTVYAIALVRASFPPVHTEDAFTP
jgi:D-alanyl-D-alanine carboxypeptidase